MTQKIKYYGKGKQIAFVLQNNPKLLYTQRNYMEILIMLDRSKFTCRLKHAHYSHKSVMSVMFYSNMFYQQWILLVASVDMCMAL
jgi:hypothetical protein